ncbi:glycosyltransferase family 4 protein [Candidatus Pelagibacter sp.]|nr:glycosyltransferase family 4 protein [Candidatus Pelagibacter sp.]
MKIFFNYQIFYQQKFGGISNYFCHLNNSLKEINVETKIICPLHINNYLKNFKKDVNGNFVHLLPSNMRKVTEYFNEKISRKIINAHKPDIIHDTYYFPKKYNSSLNSKKRVCTVFDMINEIFTKNNKHKNEISNIKKNTIYESDHIFCISNQTKNDLINLFNIDKKKITVTYLASSLKKKTFSIKKKEFENCLLFIGSRSGYKNFDNFIKAYARSKILKKDFKILAYGGEKVSKKEKELLLSLNINNNIKFINDKNYDLSYLYQNVKALVYPSKYEGFGLPILEAMENNCPVLSSFGGSLREIGGDGLEYFDPNFTEDIQNLLEKILYSEKKLKELIKYGNIRFKKFSWEKCAIETNNIYKKII